MHLKEHTGNAFKRAHRECVKKSTQGMHLKERTGNALKRAHSECV